MLDNNKDVLIALSTVPSLIASKAHQLIDYFGSAKQLWYSNAYELARSGLSQEIIDHLHSAHKRFDLHCFHSQLRELGARPITLLDNEYPSTLHRLHDPPLVLYVRGDALPDEDRCLGVVGSRKRTKYGQSAVNKLLPPLVRQGIAIVSGMAYGVDGDAHRCALENGGKTVAVLGSGIDQAYPVRHSSLMDQIAGSGCVVSEYPPGFTARKWTFPARNRIIAALSRAILVVEASAKSGALITADFAMELGKEVYAVPGSIHSTVSVGTNHLIQQGAKLIQTSDDVFEDFCHLKQEKVQQRSLPIYTGPEGNVLQTLSTEPQHIDEIVHLAGLSIEQVLPALTILVLQGLVEEYPGKYFALVS